MLYETCRECGKVHEMPYRCNLKWCPVCAQLITGRRQRILRKWTEVIDQPKHLVLTQRNFTVLSKRKIKEHKINLQKFKRTTLFSTVKGGCTTIEMTNSGEGWHLHSHWLLDVRFLDIKKVAIVWGELCGQEFGIVKIKDVRGGDYCHEVAKYVVKANEMAQWDPMEILAFVKAIKGTRFFFQFGSLLKQGPRIRAEIACEKPDKEPCECGASNWLYESEAQSVLNQIRRENR